MESKQIKPNAQETMWSKLFTMDLPEVQAICTGYINRKIQASHSLRLYVNFCNCVPCTLIFSTSPYSSYYREIIRYFKTIMVPNKDWSRP